jgi:hypothetical protein
MSALTVRALVEVESGFGRPAVSGLVVVGLTRGFEVRNVLQTENHEIR